MTIDKPKISVIIPVYNAASYTGKAVKSAESQPEVAEILLIEDGSTDNSFEVCKKLCAQHQKVRLLQHRNGKNQGAGATRNKGIIESTQPYIAFLDADDYYLENRFSLDLQKLEADTKADGIYNAIGTTFYDESGESRYKNQGRLKNLLTTMKSEIRPEELFDKMYPIGSEGFFHCNGLLVRKQVFDKVGLFDTDLELSQDTFMWMKLAAKCRLLSGEISKPVAMRGVHSSNRVADTKKLARYRVMLFEKAYKWAKKERLEKRRVEQIWLNLYYALATREQSNFVIFNSKHLLKYPEIVLYKKFWEKIFVQVFTK